MSEVRLVGISKRYDGVARLGVNDVDLTIPSGELAVLAGVGGEDPSAP